MQQVLNNGDLRVSNSETLTKFKMLNEFRVQLEKKASIRGIAKSLEFVVERLTGEWKKISETINRFYWTHTKSQAQLAPAMNIIFASAIFEELTL